MNHHAVGCIAVNRQGQDSAKGINVCIEHIKHFKRQDSFLKCVKENDRKKKRAKERDTWAQLKLYPEKDLVRTNELTCELLETILLNSLHRRRKKRRRRRSLYCKTKLNWKPIS